MCPTSLSTIASGLGRSRSSRTQLFVPSFFALSTPQGSPGMAVPDAMPVSAEDLAAAMRVINAARATPSGSAMAHNTGHQMHQQPQMQQQFFPEEPASEPGFAMSPAQSALMALAAGPSGDLGGALHAVFFPLYLGHIP